jgi:flagellar basal body-associated protein FliL
MGAVTAAVVVAVLVVGVAVAVAAVVAWFGQDRSAFNKVSGADNVKLPPVTRAD